MNKAIVELIGTYFLVLTIGLTADGSLGNLAPIAIGASLMAVIYAGGHVSAAHYNPAVTLAFRLRGRIADADIVPYLLAQLVAAGLAALTVGFLSPQGFQPAAFETGPLVVAEVIFTFALVWVILNVAIAKGTAGNPFYGAAIGLVVIGAAYAVGPISGAVLNPAVAVGLCLVGLASWSEIWIYFAAQVAGAVLAALAFGAVVDD